MKRIKIKDPVWANQLKDRVIYLSEYEDDSGAIHIVEDSVNMYPDGNGVVHDDWRIIMEEFGVAQLDANLQAIAERQARLNAMGRPGPQLQEGEADLVMKNREQEELFKAKLEAFEMDIIKNSKDREIKAKIRKATTKTEVYSYVALATLKAETQPPNESV